MPSIQGETSHLLIHIRTYKIGDKYDIVGLKDLAKEQFSRTCKHFWNTAEFLVAANHALSTAPEDDEGLKGLISDTIAGHIELAGGASCQGSADSVQQFGTGHLRCEDQGARKG